jgi:signal transduction histidine kinase
MAGPQGELDHPEEQRSSRVALASAAHELKTPVEAMLNLVYLLHHNPSLNEDARTHVELLDQELGRMRHILTQTLGVYREPATPTLVLLSSLLDTILHFWDHKIAFKQIQIDRRYECDGAVQALSQDLRQVFGNLVINALEVLPLSGRMTVHVYQSRDWRDADQTGMRVVIADNGPGILHEHRRRIFQQFFTTKGEKGTGLGLWVSAGIVHKHGGRIRFRSNTNAGHNGTVFSVFLPSRTAFG